MASPAFSFLTALEAGGAKCKKFLRKMWLFSFLRPLEGADYPSTLR
jgi:hypothetical protein